jgi:hypothetical protein
MIKSMTAVTAYRYPTRRVFWDEACTQRVGLMKLKEDGSIYIKTNFVWKVVPSNFVLYTDFIKKR